MPRVSGKTYIDPDRVLEHVRKAGLEVEPKASFHKVQGEGGRRVYIAKTKGVGRIDISGFTMPSGTPGVRDLGDQGFGGVHQTLEFEGRDERQVLATLDRVLVALRGKPARKRIARGAAAQKSA